MKSNLDRSGPANSIYRTAVSTLALAVCLGLPSFMIAQDQAADQQTRAGDAASEPAQSPEATAPAAPGGAAPQAQAPDSGWHYNPAPEPAPQSAAPQAPSPQTSAPQAPAPQSSIPQASAPQGTLPQVLTVPAATSISVRLNQWLSSDQNHAGDTFSAELDQPIVVDGWVVARRGQSVLGRVELAQKAGHGNSESKLGLGLTELTLVDGERLTVATELVEDASKGRSQGREAATIGATTAIGAIIGAAVGGGEGAAIGAGIGLTGGAAAVVSTPGRPTILRPEQLMTFQLQSPVDINTDRGHVAFRPVTQADYGRAQYANNPPQLRYPAPAPYPYGPYGPAPYAPVAAYPAPYYGSYCGGPTLWSCYPGPLYFSLGFFGGWDFPRGGVLLARPGFRR